MATAHGSSQAQGLQALSGVWDAPQPADDEARFQQEAARRRAADERARFWHLQEAEYCVQHKMMYGARFHLQRLGKVSLSPLLQERRERLIAKMNNQGKS